MSKKIWCMLKKHISTVLNPLKHHGNFWQWNQAVSDMISTYKMETSLTVVIKLWYCAVCVRVCIWWLRLPPHTRTQTHTHTDTHTRPRHRPLGFAAADMKCITMRRVYTGDLLTSQWLMLLNVITGVSRSSSSSSSNPTAAYSALTAPHSKGNLLN